MPRFAYICPHEDHVKAHLIPRVFIREGEPEPKCPEHARPAMVRQANRPYRGAKT